MDANDLRDKYLQSILQYLDIEAIIPHLIEAELVTKDEEDDLLNDVGGRSEHERIDAWVTKSTKKGPTCIPRFVACLILSKSAGGHEQLLSEVESSLDASGIAAVKRHLHRHRPRLTYPSDFRTNFISILIKHLDPVAITPHLVSAGLLQKHEQEHLLNRNITITRRMLKLVDNLGRRGQDCIPSFLHCLSVTRTAGGHQELLRQMKESEASEICHSTDHHSVSLIPPLFPTGATNLRLPQAPTNVVCTSNYIAGSQPRPLSTDQKYEELISFMCDHLNMVFGQLYEATGLFLPHEQYSNLQQECTSVTTFRSLHSYLFELGLFNPIEVDSFIVLLTEVGMPSLVGTLLNYAANIHDVNATMIVADSVPPAGYFFLYISHTNRPLTALHVWDTKEVLSTILMGRSTDRGQFWFRGFLSDKRTIVWQFISTQEQQIVSAIENFTEINSIASLVELKRADTEVIQIYPRELSSKYDSRLGKRNTHIYVNKSSQGYKRRKTQECTILSCTQCTDASTSVAVKTCVTPYPKEQPLQPIHHHHEHVMDLGTLPPYPLLVEKLRNKYTKPKWSNSVVSGPKPQTEFYVQLALIKKKKIPNARDKLTDKFLSQTLHGCIDDILHNKERIEVKDLFNGRPGETVKNQFVLAEGAPGIGKTKLSCYICTKWAEGEILQQFELVIFVPLRRFQEAYDKEFCLEDIIKLYLKSEKGKAVSEVLANNGCRNTLLILDGWDELPPELRKKGSFFYEILNYSSEFQNASVLVTSRCTVSSGLYNVPGIKRIEVLGFDSDHISDYLSSYIPDKKEMFLSHLTKFPKIRALLHIPLTLSIMCDILIQNGMDMEYDAFPSTETSLYELYILKKLVSEIKPALQGLSSFSKLPPEEYKVFQSLSQLALKGFQEGFCVFKEKHLIQVGLTVKPNLGLLRSFPCHVKAGNELFYQFNHLTIQEFLAGYCIAKLKQKPMLELLEEHRLDPKFQVIWKFFAGITKLKNKFAKKAIIDKTRRNNNQDLMLLLHCIYEVQDASVCEDVARYLERELLLDNKTLNPNDLLSLAYTLANSSSEGQWALHMRGCNIGSSGLELLHSQLLRQRKSPKQVFSLSKLDLSCNYLNLQSTTSNKQGTEILVHFIKTPFIVEKLVLDSNNFDDNNISVLAEAMCSNETITTLSLCQSNITAVGADILAKILRQNKTLKCLCLRWNNVGDEGAKHLTDALKVNSSLIALLMGNNGIGKTGFTCLCEMLKVNTKLTYLMIQGTQVNDDQCHEIVEFMPHNKSLQLLDLSKSEMGDSGVKILVEGLKQNQCSLRNLFLMDCNITNRGVEFLCELIAEGLLKSLRLGRNPNITDGSIGTLTTALRSDNTLKYLSLENCGISETVRHQLETLEGIETDVTFIPNEHIIRSIMGITTDEHCTFYYGPH